MELYGEVLEGEFLSRPNRFIARVRTGAGEEVCHVKNTGRCAELLVPGARVILAAGENPGRKTRYDLVAVYKGERLINMDSQAPNRAAREALPRLFPGLTLVQPEKTYGSSRLDFYLEAGQRRIFLEVKGVTLERKGAVFFPDAPTLRGVKHLEELERCVAAGMEGALLLVIQMENVDYFAPNWLTHPAFGHALRHAAAAGVQLMAWDCQVTPRSLTLHSPVPLCLDCPE